MIHMCISKFGHYWFRWLIVLHWAILKECILVRYLSFHTLIMSKIKDMMTPLYRNSFPITSPLRRESTIPLTMGLWCRPVIFPYVSLNKLLDKQLSGCWFEMPRDSCGKDFVIVKHFSVKAMILERDHKMQDMVAIILHEHMEHF